MKAYFFKVYLSQELDSVDTLAAAFGSNIPKPAAFEGVGRQYLFCLALPIDKILEICDTFNCEVWGSLLDDIYPQFRRRAFTELDIDDKKYNANYRATISYSRDDPPYRLVSITSAP